MRRLALALLLLAAPAHALTLSTPGQVFENQSVAGDVNVTASGVTVRNVSATGSLYIAGGTSNVRVERSTFNGTSLRVGTQGATSLVTAPTIIGCNFPNLGRGAVSPAHCVTFWNVDGAVLMFNKYDVTTEANVTGDATEGPVWYFDARNMTVRSDTMRIHTKRSVYGIWRWRSDTKLNRGCTGNKFDRFALYVDGVGGQIRMSSSANCGAQDFMAQCVGAWDAVMDSCVIDASACQSSEIEWQGGMYGWTVTNTLLATKGAPAIHAFDIHRSRFQNCIIKGDVKWTDEYQRDLWKQADMIFCNNVVTGTVTTAPRLAAVAGAYVTECSAPPTPIPPTPTPPAYGDTVHVTVKATGLPLVITVTK